MMKSMHSNVLAVFLLGATVIQGWGQTGNIDRVGFKEPSGICFHPARETLFVVGDRGHVGEMQTDGTLVRERRIRKADFEGITCNPGTGLLYIAVEGEE